MWKLNYIIDCISSLFVFRESRIFNGKLIKGHWSNTTKQGQINIYLNDIFYILKVSVMDLQNLMKWIMAWTTTHIN